MATIRIIDDDLELAETLSAVIQEAGHAVSVSETVERAVEELERETPDLLILDVMFPENSSGGFDLARIIRKTDQIKNLPIILLTAVNQEFPMDFSANDIDPEWMPVQDFVEKPVEFADLLKRIQHLLGEHS